MTKIGTKNVRRVRGRGGNYKFRALRLDSGNFSWGSESVAKKTRILDVIYNATNNELLRTKTLVKGCIVQIDATPFKSWFEASSAKATTAAFTRSGLCFIRNATGRGKATTAL